MTENTRGVIVLASILTTFFGAYLVVLWKRAQDRKSWPKTWVNTGRTPPSGLDIALSIIAKHTPGMVQAGTIEWVDGPFTLCGGTVAGALLSSKPIRVKLMYFEKVEDSALVHEMAHAWSELTNQGFGELFLAPNPNSDPRLAAWIKIVNEEIATALRSQVTA